jgi:hypothetical protein
MKAGVKKCFFKVHPNIQKNLILIISSNNLCTNRNELPSSLGQPLTCLRQDRFLSTISRGFLLLLVHEHEFNFPKSQS